MHLFNIFSCHKTFYHRMLGHCSPMSVYIHSKTEVSSQSVQQKIYQYIYFGRCGQLLVLIVKMLNRRFRAFFISEEAGEGEEEGERQPVQPRKSHGIAIGLMKGVFEWVEQV